MSHRKKFSWFRSTLSLCISTSNTIAGSTSKSCVLGLTALLQNKERFEAQHVLEDGSSTKSKQKCFQGRSLR
jgi:hypothetical protein